jgi:regulator of sigma E protease
MVVLETILFLSVLILVHELGHFVAAKLLGIRVITFSLGFGPKILKKRLFGTEFALSLIPFGGYVNMAGSEPRDDHNYEPDEFLSRPKLQRSLVVISGPLFNLLLGGFVFFLAYFGGGVTVPSGNRIGSLEEGSPFKALGVRPGDRILSVDGYTFKNWYQFDKIVSRKGIHRMKVERGGDTLSFEFTSTDTMVLGINPWIPPEIGRPLPGSPAERLGLKRGDIILRVDEREVSSWDELVEIVRAHPGETLRIEWKRGGKVLSGTIIPEPSKEKIEDTLVVVGKIGVMAPLTKVRLGLLESIRLSLSKTWEYMELTLVIIYRLITGKTSVRTLGGPIMIGKLVGETTAYGFFSLLFLMGLISINLFVINLFPFPVLDGGHLLLYSIEAVRRKRLSKKFQEIYQQIGVAVLIALMLFITFMDLLRIAGK